MSWMEFTIAMTGILIGGMIFLVPIAAFALRRAVQPLIETWTNSRGDPTRAEQIERMMRREEALEGRITELETMLGRLVEEREFLGALESRE